MQNPQLQKRKDPMTKETLHTERPIDMLTIGGIDMDMVLTVPRMPGLDEKEMAKFLGWMPGGPAANAACAAARLGLHVASFSQVGDDENGRAIVADFARHGVDTSLMETVTGQQSPFTVILIDPSGEKVILVVPGFEAVYSAEKATAVLPNVRYLYMMPNREETFLTLARLAHQHGAQVMIDIEPTVCAQRDKLERLLAETDIVSFNRFGFEAAAGAAPAFAAARQLLDYGPHTVIVTRGRGGVLAVTHDEEAEHPGFPVEVADTTGAGDTFHAAYLAATIRGMSLAERLRFASATAAISVTAIGPRGRLPTWAEVEEFLKNSKEL